MFAWKCTVVSSEVLPVTVEVFTVSTCASPAASTKGPQISFGAKKCVVKCPC